MGKDQAIKQFHQDSKDAVEKLISEVLPMAHKLKAWAVDSKRWVRANSVGIEVSDNEIADHSIQYGDIIITYAIEDHGQKGVFQVLTVMMAKDFMTVPQQIVAAIVGMFMDMEKDEVKVMRQVAQKSKLTINPDFDITIAIGKYHPEVIVVS